MNLRFDLGRQHLSIWVSSKNDFVGTLRNMKGVSAVSSDREQLIVELDEFCVPSELVTQLKRIYPALKVSDYHDPAPRPR